MPSIADVFMRIRIDPSRVKRDAEEGLGKADATAAGVKAGAQFGEGVKRGADGKLRDLKGRFVTDAEAARAGEQAGRVYGDVFGKTARSRIEAQLAGIKGPSWRATGIGAGIATGGALLPVALAAGSVGLLGAGALGVAALGAKTLIGSKDTKQNPNAQGPLYAQAQQIGKTFSQVLGTAAQGILPVMRQVFAQIGPLIKSLQGPLTQVFAGAGSIVKPFVSGVGQLAKDVLPLLAKAFNVVGPLVVPILAGFDVFSKAVLPALITLLKSAGPAVSALGTVLGGLGKAVAGILAGVAPGVKASSQIFVALGRVVDALAPVLAQVAVTLAQGLAPAFTVVAGVLTGVARVLALIPPKVLSAITLGFLGIAAALKAWELGVMLVSLATKAWAAIQGALNVVLDANPIGLITIAVAALAVGIYELYKHWNTVWGSIKQIAEDAWHWLWTNVFAPIETFFVKTLPAWFDTAVGFVNSHFVKPFQNAIAGAWAWVTKNVFDPIRTFLTQTLPGVFTTAVNGIEKMWRAVQSAISVPLKAVVNLVWNPFATAVDAVAGFFHLGHPLNTINTRGWATGGSPGKIFAGSSATADDVLVRVSRGETIISAAHSRALAPALAAIGVPGYASGGVIGGIGSLLGGIGSSILSFLVPKPVRDALGLLTGNLLGKVPAGDGFTGLIHGIFGGLLGGATHWLGTTIKNLILGSGGTGATGPLPGGGTVVSGAVAAAQAYAQGLLPAFGWGLNQWPPLQALWNGESGWRWNALNASSGAYGIPQSLPADKMASAGADWRTNPGTQIRWGLGYIRSVYGSPGATFAAWSSRSPHWYGNGGPINEPIMGIGLRSGDSYGFGESGPEDVVPRGRGRGGGRGGRPVNINLGGVVIREEADISLLASKLGFAMTAEGL
jgi:phage-related protein